jgi:cytochrome c
MLALGAMAWAAHANDQLPTGDLAGHGGPVKAVAVSPSGSTALSGSFDYSMMQWDITDPARPGLVNRFTDHDGAVNAVAFVPGSKLALSGSDDGIVRIWNMETASLLHAFEAHQHKVVGLAVSADARLAASASWDRTVRVYDLAGRKLLHELKGHKNTVNAAVFRPMARTSLPPERTAPSASGG